MRKWLGVGIVILFDILAPCRSIGAAQNEILGRLTVDELSIGAAFLLREKQQANFSLDESLVGLGWHLDRQLSGHLALGSLSLLNQPLHFNSPRDDNWGLVEAYAEYSMTYGQIRMGLIPLRYGIDGSRREGDLAWSRHLLFRRQIVGLRDYGFSFSTDYQGYYTRLAIHNGEGHSNLDNRVWMTASWGWSDDRVLNLGLSGNTGTTKPVVTSGSGDHLAGVNPDLPAKWRMGTAFIQWTPNEWNTLLEMTWGGLQQDLEPSATTVGNQLIGKFFASHFDLGYDWNTHTSTLFRFDYLDPDRSHHLNDPTLADVEREISLGWCWKSSEGNSRFYVMATKVLEDRKVATNNDEIRILWRVSAEPARRLSPIR